MRHVFVKERAALMGYPDELLILEHKWEILVFPGDTEAWAVAPLRRIINGEFQNARNQLTI